MNKIQLTLVALLLGSLSLYGCASTIVAADNGNTASAPHSPGAATAPAAQSATEAGTPAVTSGEESGTGTFRNAKPATPN